MGTKSKVTDASGKPLITYTVRAHKTRLKNGQKVDISRRKKTIPEEKDRDT